MPSCSAARMISVPAGTVISLPSIVSVTICALADGAVSPIQSSLKYFRAEYEQHVAERRCPFTGIGPGVETVSEPVTESAFADLVESEGIGVTS